MTMQRAFFALLVGFGLLVSTAPSQAQAADDTAVVNYQDIMRDSSAAKSIKEQFNAKQKAFSSEFSGKEQELQKEQQELAKQRSVLSQEAFEKKIREFNTKASAVQKDVQAKKLALDKGLGQAYGEIQKAVSSILADLAKEKGFILVVPTQQVLYNDPRLDVTQEVLSRLNKNLTKVTVNFDAK